MPSSAPMKTVLSASRRTDIPAFYMDWFMAGIGNGFFKVINPYNGRERTVACGPDQVHTIVFWSKNMGPLLDGRYGERLLQAGYHLFFNFTINSEDTLLEPNLPPLTQRLAQLRALAERFEGRRIFWRFDPLCFYQLKDRVRKNNLGDFLLIADAAAEAGITRCITSFMDQYRKIARRAAAVPGLVFVELSLSEQQGIILKMEQQLADRGIHLSLCCEKEVLSQLPENSTVSAASCVPNDLFIEYDGGTLPLKKDAGQRRSAGCGCRMSIDVGSYRQQPCFHNCLFCYANPTPPKTATETGQRAIP